MIINNGQNSGNEMTHRTCPVCSNYYVQVFLKLKPRYSIKSSLGVRSTEMIIYSCKNCGVLFSSNLFSTDNQGIDDMYDQNYHDSLTGSIEYEKKSGILEHNRFRVNLVKQFVSKGALLDIGCSTGYFLEAARNAEFQVYGLEPSIYASELSRKRLDYGEERIEKALISESKLLADGKYDIITLWDVIEHFYLIREDLKHIIDALKKNGILVIRTPNKASIFFTLSTLLHNISFGLINNPAISIFHKDHNFFFSKKSLKMILAEFGLTVLKISPDPVPWKRFRYVECRRNIILNSAISLLYMVTRLMGGGHGMIIIAKK
ncbi:MAG: class I SAM-dependent methyltransferase [Nitrospirae bacterium]|nr:class I SAM-dependent methyltransferase [Nitrospirota bacterium]